MIEDIRADQNTYCGMSIQGNGNIIRNNQVVATEGATAYGSNTLAYGIQTQGPGARVLNNDVTEVASQGTGSAYGIYLYAASNSVVAGNRVGNLTSPGGSSFGIYLVTGADLIVSDNRLSGTQYGIYLVNQKWEEPRGKATLPETATG